MRKILSVAVVALAACSSSSERQQKPITYAAPQAPTPSEVTAIQGAEATLQSSVTFVAPTQPTAGGPGLADQLAMGLGAYAAAAKTPDASSAKLAHSAVQQAFATGTLDPACMTTVVANGTTTVTWGAVTPCVVDYADPTTTMSVKVSGTISWTPGAAAGTGVTAWNIHEDYTMATTSGGQPVSASGFADLDGSLTVGPDTIGIDSTSLMHVDTVSMGMRIGENVVTTLVGTVGYVSTPSFCITSGGLRLEHRVTMAGFERAEGWNFTWSGCGAFTVAHGS